MSGRRPSKTKVWNFIDHFREPQIGGDPAKPWVSMPGWFKSQGYYVHGMGKLYHPGNPPNDDGNFSWSDPSRYSQNGALPLLPGAAGVPAHTHTAALLASVGWEEQMAGPNGCITGQYGGSYCEINGTVGPDDHLMQASVGHHLPSSFF